MGEQRGVVGLHEDRIAQANDGDGRAVFRARIEDDVPLAIDVDEIGDGAIAIGVGREVTREGVPRTEIIPRERAVGDDDVFRVLHQRVVDRDFFDERIFLGEHLVQLRRAREIEPAMTGLGHLGLMLLQALGDGDETPDEHARVPAILAAGEIFLGSFVIRFFHETLGLEERGFVGLQAVGRRQFHAGLNVAVAGRRLGGLDADGHNHLPATGEIERVGEHLLKFLRLGNDVIRWQHGHDGLGRALADNRRAERDGGASVASAGLGDDVGLGQFRQLLADLRGLHRVGDDENIFEGHHRQDALDGLLQERGAAQQRDELLRGFLAAHGPEAFAPPARHDDYVPILLCRFAFHEKRIAAGKQFFRAEFSKLLQPAVKFLDHLAK